jgi:hypothetical protein
MEYIPKFNIEQEKNSLYKYSGELGLMSIIKERNDENKINNSDNISKEKTEFLIKLANILENKLRINIRLHQKGFETYKQKLTSERDLILNNTRDIKDLTIKQIIDILISIKNNTYNQNNNSNNYFSIGKIPSNKKKDNNDNILSSLQGMSKIFFPQQNTENNSGINNNKQFNFNAFTTENNYQNMNVNTNEMNLINNKIKNNKLEKHINIKINHNHNLGFKNKQFNDPRKIYHSPSPYIKKYDSKIIEENKNVNNQINFEEDQKIFNN